MVGSSQIRRGDKYGKNYKIASLEQFKKNKNPSILLGSLYLIGEYKKREL